MSELLTHPRIAPLEPPYEPAIEAMLAKWMPPASAVEPLALFRTLAVHDGLFSRMRPLGAGILATAESNRASARSSSTAPARWPVPSTSGGCTRWRLASRSASATSRSMPPRTAPPTIPPGPIATRPWCDWPTSCTTPARSPTTCGRRSPRDTSPISFSSWSSPPVGTDSCHTSSTACGFSQSRGPRGFGLIELRGVAPCVRGRRSGRHHRDRSARSRQAGRRFRAPAVTKAVPGGTARARRRARTSPTCPWRVPTLTSLFCTHGAGGR